MNINLTTWRHIVVAGAAVLLLAAHGCGGHGSEPTPHADEDAATRTVADAVSATDPDRDTVTHSMASGNGYRVSSIYSDTGKVIVSGALDYESVSSYTLTVEARDGKENGTAQATVEITLTDVAETPPPRRGT